MAMTKLEEHYNKFNEDKRLERRHGQVEYLTTMHYIHETLAELQLDWQAASGGQRTTAGQTQQELSSSAPTDLKILEIGAGTGRYSLTLAAEGYDVTAVELVKYNLGIMKQHARRIEAGQELPPSVTGQTTASETAPKSQATDAPSAISLRFQAYQGNALKLKRFADNSFDLTLLLGPMYHLYTEADKLQALAEAKRVTRPGGRILVAYLMNEYCVVTYGFKEGHVGECLADGRLDADYHCHGNEEMLYDYVRLEDIRRFAAEAGLERVKILSADGPADYLRAELKAMDEETFARFMDYHLMSCERPELLGAGAHTLDILRK